MTLLCEAIFTHILEPSISHLFVTTPALLADITYDFDPKDLAAYGEFMIFHVVKATRPIGDDDEYEMVEFLSIVKKHSEDLRDQLHTKVKVILGGTGLMIQVAAVPFWFLDHYKGIFGQLVPPHKRIQEDHQIFVAEYSDKESDIPKVHKTLIRFPDWLVVSADTMAVVPQDDTFALKPNIYPMVVQTLEATRRSRATKQSFHPCFWALTVVPEKAQKMNTKKAAEEDVADMFAAKLSVGGKKFDVLCRPPTSDTPPATSFYTH